jgi:hypothetical protein
VSSSVLTAIVAVISAGTILWLGRRDLSRPAVAFGVPWFGAVALAQLRLTDVEQPWSTGFTLIALGGGAAFVVAATLASGTAPARGALSIERRSLRERRLVAAALVLVAAGVAGAAYKAHQLGAVALFSDNPDAVRARAGAGGDRNLPSWSSALTNGFYLGMWCALAAVCVGRSDRSHARTAGLWLLAAVALLGVSLEASRNLVLFALAIPAITAYLLARPRGSARQVAWVTAAVCLLALGVSGLFVARLARTESSARSYVDGEIERQPAALRPLVPLYLNVAFPLEAARRLEAAVPDQLPYGLGGNSLTSLPDAAFPEGKPGFGGDVSGLMRTTGGDRLSWAVATYQGRLLADLGWQGVLLGSLLLGLGFGALYRWARTIGGFLGTAVIAYAVYYAAYMTYDNLLSFTLIAVWDIAVIALVGAYCSGRVARPAASS